MTKPQKWPTCDADIQRFVQKLLNRLIRVLNCQLTGIYLHGSLAMGRYYRPKSDIDLIVVVKEKLTSHLAEKVSRAIAEEAGYRPVTGNVELSVITAETAEFIPIPSPYEVHYSTEWHDKILNGQVDYTAVRIDPDLPSHLTYVIQRGICLYGQPIKETFGNVSWEHFICAVQDDLEWILEDEHILETPYYSVLNICRVFQLYSENMQFVHSKDEGGEWGLQHLPEAYHPLIQQSLQIYRSSENVTEENRRTGGISWDSEALLAFRDYARKKIRMK